MSMIRSIYLFDYSLLTSAPHTDAEKNTRLEQNCSLSVLNLEMTHNISFKNVLNYVFIKYY